MYSPLNFAWQELFFISQFNYYMLKMFTSSCALMALCFTIKCIIMHSFFIDSCHKWIHLSMNDIVKVYEMFKLKCSSIQFYVVLSWQFAAWQVKMKSVRKATAKFCFCLKVCIFWARLLQRPFEGYKSKHLMFLVKMSFLKSLFC